jgi:hypothetical protein
MLTNIYPVIKFAHLLYMNIHLSLANMPIVFRGLFVVFFLLIIFFTGEKGIGEVKE